MGPPVAIGREFGAGHGQRAGSGWTCGPRGIGRALGAYEGSGTGPQALGPAEGSGKAPGGASVGVHAKRWAGEAPAVQGPREDAVGEAPTSVRVKW